MIYTATGALAVSFLPALFRLSLQLPLKENFFGFLNIPVLVTPIGFTFLTQRNHNNSIEESKNDKVTIAKKGEQSKAYNLSCRVVLSAGAIKG
jgi:hypothetical protein